MVNMTKSKNGKNGVERLVHHCDPTNKQMPIDSKFAQIFDGIKMPKHGSKNYAMVCTMLNGKPISINDVVEWYKIIEPNKNVSKSNHTQHFVNVGNFVKPYGLMVSTNIDKTKILIEIPK